MRLPDCCASHDDEACAAGAIATTDIVTRDAATAIAAKRVFFIVKFLMSLLAIR